MGNYCSHEENDGYCLECHNETVEELNAEITRLRTCKNAPARIESVSKAIEQCVREASYLEERAENMDEQDWQDFYFGKAKKILIVADREE